MVRGRGRGWLDICYQVGLIRLTGPGHVFRWGHGRAQNSLWRNKRPADSMGLGNDDGGFKERAADQAAA